MKSSAFNLGEQLSLHDVGYKLLQSLWGKHDLTSINLDFGNWKSIKYLNEDGTDFSPEINELPDDKGGIYLFYIKCPIIKGLTEFPFYVGRAQLTVNHSLRVRCRKYFNEFRHEEERPKITRMFYYWGKDLHLAYVIIDDNNDVIDYEKKLINSLLLPMNDQIPDKEIRDAVKAF